METKETDWITGPALQTVIALKAMQRGDWVKCSECRSIHTFGFYNHPKTYSNQSDFQVMRDGEDIGGMSESEVTAWKPKKRCPPGTSS